MMVALGAQSVGAQSPTPINVPSPTAEGCDQVPAYLEARQKIFDEVLTGMGAIFPDVATPITSHGDELFAAMLMMTPEQFTALAKVYEHAASEIEKIEAPAVAAYYNGLQAQLYRLSAKVFEEAATVGLTGVSAELQAELGALGEGIGTSGAAATSFCPAFADVVKLDQTQAGI